MSSLSINGLGQGLSQLFGGFSSPGSAGPAASISGTSTTTASAGTATTQTGTQQAGAHHHRHGGGKQFQQIQNAITNALQSAQSSGSTSDPNRIIEDAIAKVFKQASGASSSSSTSSSALGAADTDADGDVDAPGETNTDNSPQQAFLKTLQALGVSPQQFRADFVAAIEDAQQSGNVDVSSALKSLPKGSTLDAIG